MAYTLTQDPMLIVKNMKKERKKEKKKEKEKSRIRQIRELCRITLIPEVVRIRALFYREIIPRKDPYTIQTQLRIQKSISASESFFSPYFIIKESTQMWRNFR